MRNSTSSFFLAILIAAMFAGGCKPIAIGGGSDTYGVCAGAADCNSGIDTCTLVMSTGSNRFCSRRCSTGTDCPTSRDGTPYGVCLPVASGTTMCYSHCRSDRDCPVGWMCNPGTLRGAACTPR